MFQFKAKMIIMANIGSLIDKYKTYKMIKIGIKTKVVLNGNPCSVVHLIWA